GDAGEMRSLLINRSSLLLAVSRSCKTPNLPNNRRFAGPVARGKDEEVERLENDRHSDEDERDGRENGPGHEDDGEGERRVYEGASHVREPQERRVRAGALGHEVPARVDDRRDEHEAEREGAHRSGCDG